MRPSFALVAALALAAPAAAFDLTGTWEGKQTCGDFNGTAAKFTVPSSTIQITQVGTAIVMLVDGADYYNGVGIDATAKPETGRTYFVHCGTSDVPGNGVDGFDETGSASVKTKDNGSGSLKGGSTFYNNNVDVGVCKWTYKRTSTTNPNLTSPCAPAM